MPSFEEELKAATTAGENIVAPGIVVVAADRKGQIRYKNAVGVTSLDESAAKPITADNTFWIASCTKLMTTICALQCVERGLLTLDDNIGKIVPEFRDPDILTGFENGEPKLVKATKKITLRHLLTHSSGLGYEFLNKELMQWMQWKGKDPKQLKTDIEKDYVMPLLFEPGDGWNYSCGIDWAGKMVERVNGGMRLRDFMKQNVWDKVGITDAAFKLDENHTVKDRLVGLSKRDGTRLSSVPPMRDPNPKDDLGGGGLYTSPNEYVKVLIALLKNDGTLLEPSTVKMMFTPQLPDDRYLLKAFEVPENRPMMTSGVSGSNAWNWGLGMYQRRTNLARGVFRFHDFLFPVELFKYTDREINQGGLLNMEDVEGITTKGTMTWGGLPNLFWWIDPVRGNCGMYASQIIPPGDAKSLDLAVEFRKHIFKETAKM